MSGSFLGGVCVRIKAGNSPMTVSADFCSASVGFAHFGFEAEDERAGSPSWEAAVLQLSSPAAACPDIKPVCSWNSASNSPFIDFLECQIA